MKRAKQIGAWICCVALAGAVMSSCSAAKLEHSGENNMSAPAAQAAETTRLTVMSYNVKDCDNGDKIAEIAADIQKETPAVVCVQEIDKETERSGKKDVLKLLAEQVKMNYHFYPSISLQGGTYGVGILSVYPLENCEMTPLSVRKKDEGRVLAKASITVNGKKISLFNTHLSYENKDTRLKQLDFLQETVSSQNPFILTGDFNIAGFEEYGRLKGVQMVNNAQSNYESFVGDEEGFRSLDNIIVPDGVKILSQKMGDTSASDHRPLIAHLEF